MDNHSLGDKELEKIEIELLLEGIYQYYGYDFRNYAYPFIKRRIEHRLKIENIGSISRLQDLILHHSSMMDRLFSDFSISVTEMFRDPGFFWSFRNGIIPLIRHYPSIRIWNVGCASGEEAYSMAILLEEEGLLHKTRIYATDINKHNLDRAKTGSFPLEKMQLYTKNYLSSGGKKAFSEYYTVKNKVAQFKEILKEHLIFAQHDVTMDQSFNDFTIIICRNVMIYFNKDLQNHVHQLLYNSLVHSGFLGLGRREEIRFTDYAKFYEAFDAREKIYSKIR